MRILSLLLLSFAAIPASAQIGTGQWRMHIPASQAIDVAAGNGLVMTALNGGVLEYDIAAAENRILNRLNALSDVVVSCITFEPSTNSFFVGYENGNLDQITSSGNIVNIPAVKLAQINGNKRINKMIPAGGKLYLATGFSVVVIDPSKSEVRDTWYPTNGTEGINDVLFAHDSVYVLSNSGLHRGLASNLFLADPGQWTDDVRVPNPTNGYYGEMGLYNDEVYLSRHMNSYGSDTIFQLANSGLITKFTESFFEIHRFHISDGLFNIYIPGSLIAFNPDGSVNYGVEQYGSTAADPKMVVIYDNWKWVADGTSGLVRYLADNTYSFIQREGPARNSFFSLNGNDGKMIVTGGILDRVSFAYNTSGAYAFEDESWKLYDKANQTNWASAQIWDIGVAAVDPKNTDNIALGCYCIDALSLATDDQVTNVYNAGNSGLEATTLGNGNVCISSLEFDSDGNLWVLNCYSNAPLKVRLEDGTWLGFETGGETKARFAAKLAIDYNGNKWFGSYNVGLVGYDDNNTPADTGDDNYRILRTGEGVGNLPSDVVTAIAVDFDNEIWIGTENGFAVLYNSDQIFTASAGQYDASRILITYEGNVENLLGNTPITDIEIDGGNRKWIATASTGIFLLSADGQTVISQFTRENSPLISNNIMDMEFNHRTGELFIVTDLGLVSYRSDASYEDATYETTTVFPNPVKPDFFGPITIQGIRYDSDVKVTDAAGNLVYQTTSNGGTATWNGKTLSGENVASGVYFFWTATNGGKSHKVGKVVVIR